MSSTAAVHTGTGNTQDEIQKYHAFVTLAIILAAITGIEIVIIYIEPLAWWFVATALIFLSLVKFVCVVTWFMHLIYDKPLTTVLFTTGMILGGGTAVALVYLLSPTRAYDLNELQDLKDNYPLPVISAPASR
jgi:cytochrome c oxidase subunit 4